MYWSGVTADTPPKYCGYGSLRERGAKSPLARPRETSLSACVCLPVSELVHGHRQVRGELLVAGVGVVVVLRQQVHVVQEDAAPVFVSESLPHAHVEQLGPVERPVAPLTNETRTRLQSVQSTQPSCYGASPAARCRCCSGSAASGGKGAGDRAAPAGGSAGSGTAPLWPCGGGARSPEAGSVRRATPAGSSV